MTRVEQSRGWRPAVAWLVEAVRRVSNDGVVGDVPPRPRSVSGIELAEAADFHGVPGFAWLAAAPVAEPVLAQVVHQAQARHLRAMSDLALVVAALDRAGIGFLVAKGPALVATCYSAAHLRSYVDIDLLVRPRDLKAAVAALTTAGFRLLDANWPLLTAHLIWELRLEGPTGGAVDLHWSLSPGSGDEDTAPPAGRLIRRATRVTDDTVSFPVPSPADLAVHVAVHAASSGGHRLVWLADLRGSLRYALDATSPGVVLDTAREWRALPTVSLMAGRTRRLLGTELPGELTDPWSLRLWAGVDVAAGALAGPLLAGEGSSPSRLVARSCRATVPASLGAVVRKGWNGARTGRPVPPGRELMHDATNPMSALYPAGGDAAAEAYYERVAEEDRE